MPRVQGIIQRLEQFTSKLSSSDENQILRLRHGKIRKGAYRGTKKGRFKHWMAKPFLSKEAKAKRKEYLLEVTNTESRVLAKALCADISKRTPVPYEVDRQVTVRDVKIVLEESKEDREEFARTVREFTSSSATTSQLRKNPMDAARKRLEQALMDRSIRHHDQIKQLHKEAVEILTRQKKTKKSRRQPLADGEPLLELKNVKKLKKQIGSLVEEKMLSLALFREAEEYAMREPQPDLEATPQEPISDERRLELLDDFVRSDKAQKAPRKSVALLAAKHMLENGVEVREADIPNLDSSQPPENLKREQEALANEVKRYRGQREEWAHQVADLLENHQFKEARLVEDLARDSEAMRLLGNVREAFADQTWDNYLKKQRKKIKKGKKIQVQSHDKKRVRSRGPSLRKIRPQTYLDRIRPWRGNHTRVATTHAKQMISRPTRYDGNVLPKEAIIEQTLGKMQAKYRELSWDSNTYLLRELRDYLEKNIHDRQVAVTEPVIRMKRPLDDIPLDTRPVSSEEVMDDSFLPTTPDSLDNDDIPQFDTSQFEAGSVVSTDSGNVSDLGKIEDLDDMEKDVFEPETPIEVQDTLSELVNVAKEQLRPKSVSDLDDLQDKDELPRQRSTSVSDSTNQKTKLSPVNRALANRTSNWYAKQIKSDQGPPPLPPEEDTDN